MKEKKSRSLSKAVTYRVLATIATVFIAYFFTHNLELATSIGLIDTVIKLLLFYINERVWTRLKWGYQEVTYAKTTKNNPYEFKERRR